jgi:chromosome segregation ATPase
MPGFYHHLSSATVDDITREHYGYDVPHLVSQINHLQDELRSTNQHLRRKRHEYNDLKQKYSMLQRNYVFVWEQLDRYKAKWKEARARLKWRY